MLATIGIIALAAIGVVILIGGAAVYARDSIFYI
jgi:hypothetical protein